MRESKQLFFLQRSLFEKLEYLAKAGIHCADAVRQDQFARVTLYLRSRAADLSTPRPRRAVPA